MTKSSMKSGGGIRKQAPEAHFDVTRARLPTYLRSLALLRDRAAPLSDARPLSPCLREKTMTIRRPRGLQSLVTVASFLLASLPAPAAVPAGSASRLSRHASRDESWIARPLPSSNPDASKNVWDGWDLALYDGSVVTVNHDGLGAVRDPQGRSRPFTVPPQIGRSALGETWGPDRREIVRRASLPQRGAFAPEEILVALADSSPSLA